MKFLSFTLILTGLLSQNAFGNFSQLANEFLDRNLDLKSSELQIQSAILNDQALEMGRSWMLSSGMTYSNNALDTASSFNLNQTKNLGYSLGIAKSTLFGTTFQLENNLIQTDRSQVNQAFLGNAPAKVWEFNQKVGIIQSLGQNLFGQQDQLDQSMTKTNIEINQTQHQNTKDLALSAFYQNYLNASYYRLLINLQTQALQRANQRTKLIDKKVKDGLREKADLYSAQATELEQKENLQARSIDLNNALKALSSSLHRYVGHDEITPLELNKTLFTAIPSGQINQNLELQTLNKKENYYKQNLEKKEMGVFPEIDLSLYYKTNQYDQSTGKAISEGLVTGPDNEWVVALGVTMPLGFGPQKTERSQGLVSLKSIQLQKEGLAKNHTQQEIYLMNQIQSLDDNIQSGKERLKLAQKVLDEYNKLYSLGRADLDQVIRAEEGLIMTQQGLARYIIDRELRVAILAQLYGKLYSTIIKPVVTTPLK